MKKRKNKNYSYWQDVLSRFLRHKMAVFGLAVIILELLCVLALPSLLHLNPNRSDFRAGAYADPSAAHWLGTDDVCRDLFARVLYGGRTSLYVGVLSALISIVIGAPLGLLAGYYGKAVEMVVMRLADLFQSFPSMILVLVLVSLIGPSVASVTLVIGVLGWASSARILYSSVLSIRERDYVEAARAIGTKDGIIMCKYVLPNAFAPLLVNFSFSIASAILTESGLSFLGMGVQPPNASWGNILYAAQSISILANKPHVWVPTGLLVMLTVLSFNFLGDGIRDALDPKMKV